MVEPLRLLVVDDEPDVELLFRQRFRRKLKKGEVELVFAHDGVEALEVLGARPDLNIVLSDINMPRMDGLELLSEIQALDRVLDLVIVSAYGDMGNIRTAMNRGAFDFLTKPLDFGDLDATIEKTQQHVCEALEAIAARERARELSLRNAFIRETFGRYVSEEVVTELLDHPEGLELGGVRRGLTVLFSDLRGFTALSERMAPEDVVRLLNRFFEAMFPVIHRYKGTINAIIGDGLFVLFGAPIEMADSAERAIACALEMQAALVEMGRREADLPEVEMGIGIHTGTAVVGNIGNEQRSHYSATGRDVNLAARVEAATVGRQVLISQQTLDACGPELSIKSTFEVAAKGLSRPIQLHEVTAIGGDHAISFEPPEPLLTVLTEPLSVTFWVLDGKATQGPPQSGRLTHLSRHHAQLDTETALEALADLRMEIQGPEGGALEGDLYAKVLAGASDAGLRVGFTAVSPAIDACISSLLD